MFKRVAAFLVCTCTALSACSSADSGSGSAASSTSGSADSAVVVTDVLGRKVEFDSRPERIILGEGRGVP